MNAYMYQAALYCEDCALAVRDELEKAGNVPEDVLRGGHNAIADSEHWPVGPFADGGGESDSPSHCGSCGVFLENELTSDGWDMVRDSVADYLATGQGNRFVVREWIEFYDVTLSELLDRVEARL